MNWADLYCFACQGNNVQKNNKLIFSLIISRDPCLYPVLPVYLLEQARKPQGLALVFAPAQFFHTLLLCNFLLHPLCPPVLSLSLFLFLSGPKVEFDVTTHIIAQSAEVGYSPEIRVLVLVSWLLA